MKFRKHLKRSIERLIGRKIVTVPLDSTPIIIESKLHANILPIRYNYRATDEGDVFYNILQNGDNFRYALFASEFSNDKPQFENHPCLAFQINRVNKGDRIRVNLQKLSAWINDLPVSTTVSNSQPHRKYNAIIELTTDRKEYTRTCSHYLPYSDKQIAEDYYFGDDYINYPKQINTTRAVEIVGRYKPRGVLLDIGCALGYYTKAFLDAGYDAYGIDSSAYAVKQAQDLVGEIRIKKCNPDTEEISFKNKFDILYMWDVLEHSTNPRLMLEKATKVARKGALLVLHTSNSCSLTHLVMGDDWEGYSDYSHRGVDKVNADNLPKWLEDLGWKIMEWECNNIWVSGRDQTLHSLRDAFIRIPELNVLLKERNLGDLITILASKL